MTKIILHNNNLLLIVFYLFVKENNSMGGPDDAAGVSLKTAVKDVVTKPYNYQAGDVVTTTTATFPKDYKFGLQRAYYESLTLTDVIDGGWASRETNLKNFVDWRFVQITINNKPFEINTDTDFERAKASMKPGDLVSFSLQKVCVLFLTSKNH